MNEDAAVWFLAGDNNQPQGPYRTADVLNALRQGQLRAGGLCWKDGMPGWQSLADVPPFSEVAAQAASGDGGQVNLHADSLALGKAVSRMVGLTQMKAKTMSLKMTINSHEKRRGQLLAELGDMLYKRESDIGLLSQEPYAEKVRQVKFEDQSIESLRQQIERMKGTVGPDDSSR